MRTVVSIMAIAIIVRKGCNAILKNCDSDLHLLSMYFFLSKFVFFSGKSTFLSDFVLNWMQTTSTAFTPPRSAFGCLQYQNKVLIMGGNFEVQGQTQFLNDVWMSIDGTTWSNLQPAQWSTRSRWQECNNFFFKKEFWRTWIFGTISFAVVNLLDSIYVLAVYGLDSRWSQQIISKSG